jgi:hypothetical protein
MSFLCTASLPFSFPRKCHYSEKFSRPLRHSPYPESGRLFICPPLCSAVFFSSQWRFAISTAMAAGLASASIILMAGKPPVGTDCRQELSRAPLLLPDRDCRPFRSCRLSGGRVKRPVASIVRCFPSSERGVVSPTNLCPVRETPLSAYSLPLQGELTFVSFVQCQSVVSGGVPS